MYWFSKCPEEKVDKIGDLCTRLGMKEYECNPPMRQWVDEVRGKVGLVRYDGPAGDAPQLIVQCWPPYNHLDPQVRTFLRELVDLTGVDEIYEDFNRTLRVNSDSLR